MTCFKCGANPWTDCKHRKAEREEPGYTDDTDSTFHKWGSKYKFDNLPDPIKEIVREWKKQNGQ